MNISMECDIRVEMCSHSGEPLLRTCGIWAFEEHDKDATKMYCNRNKHLIMQKPIWRFDMGTYKLKERLQLFQHEVSRNL